MSIIYLVGAGLFFAICQGFVTLCARLQAEGGQ